MPELSEIQKLIVEQFSRGDEGRDLLVSAGAGSGKTFVLVESVLACLRAGIAFDDILVVTFTDKAAAEMKNRIYDELGRDPSLSALRLRLPNAWISTIHSFCGRLLRDRYEIARIDPRFRVLSDEDAKILLDDCTTRVFHDGYGGRWGERKTEQFEELVEMCGFGSDGEQLRQVVWRLLDYARASEQPGRFLAKHEELLGADRSNFASLEWAEDYRQRVLMAWHEALGFFRYLQMESMAYETGENRYAELLSKLERIDPASLSTPEQQRQILDGAVDDGWLSEPTWKSIELPPVPRGSGPVLSWFRSAVVKAFRKDRWLSEMPIDEGAILRSEGQAKRIAHALIEVTQRIWRSYEERKDRSGCYDFEDLQIRALHLIEQLAGTEQAVRFPRVFIDEFQDVNRLQHRILSQVGEPSGTFRVGDIKQSIYQFRLAAPEIIRDLGSSRAAVTDAAKAPEQLPAWNVILPTNYRSLEPVLTVVNRISSQLFLAEEIGSDYESQSLVAASTTPEHAPAVEIIAVTDDQSEEEDPTAQGTEEDGPSDLQETEWQLISQRVRELLDSCAAVRDPEDLKLRPVQISDIAILLRAKSHGPSLARHLEQEGIACSLGSDDPFFEAREIVDTLQVLRTIDNLLDDISLAAALRSPAFGWTDSELLALRLAYPQAVHLAFALAELTARTGDGERLAAEVLPQESSDRQDLSGLAADLPPEPPFSTLPNRAHTVLDSLLKWRRLAGTVELPDLITRVFQDTGLTRSVASLPGGLRRQANLRKFLGLARRHVEESGHNLHRFLRWIETVAQSGARISEAPIASESVPAVRILTIHAAKGLEFPVVILADMGRRYTLGTRIKPLVPGSDYLGVQLLDVDSYLLSRPIPLDLLLDQNIRNDLAEEKRVLYVALTRARDRLILIGSAKRSSLPEETHIRAYQLARESDDPFGRAMTQTLLAAKPRPLAWVLYALTGDPSVELPILLRWVDAMRLKETAAGPSRLSELETSLLALEEVPVPSGDDPDAVEIFERTMRSRDVPTAGLLRKGRAKIWATEFKSRHDLQVRGDRSTESESTDDPAEPLIRDSSEAAVRRGIEIHELLECLTIEGLTQENLKQRIMEAADRLGDLAPETIEIARAGIGAILRQPLGQEWTTSQAIHREVDFSLRIPLLEVTRWLPDLRQEILSSSDWSEWVEPGLDGALRIRSQCTMGTAPPWVLVQGRIDLVFREADRWTVLDWKSDAVEPGMQLDTRVDVYRGQMEIYKRAAEILFGRPARAILFFLRPGIAREI